MFCISLFVLLSFFFWPLCCLFFFDIRILITPLVSSNSSYRREEKQSKNTTQYALDTTMHKQTQITQIRHIEGNCYHVFLTYIFYISLFNMILLCPWINHIRSLTHLFVTICIMYWVFIYISKMRTI
jgi:hypothetical protein